MFKLLYSTMWCSEFYCTNVSPINAQTYHRHQYKILCFYKTVTVCIKPINYVFLVYKEGKNTLLFLYMYIA